MKKFNSIENLISEEFEKSAPSLREDVLNAPIETESRGNAVNAGGNTLAVLTSNKLSVISTALFLALVFLTTILIIAINAGKPKIPVNYMFTYEINPAVVFVTDEDGVVVSVNSLNPDADVVLSNEETVNSMKGDSLADALKTYTDRAAKLGYLDIENRSAVRLSGLKGGSKGVLNSAKEGLQAYFKEKGYYVAVAKSEVSEDTLLSRASFKSGTIKKAAVILKDAKTLYGESFYDNRDLDDEAVKKIYDDYFSIERKIELLKATISENETTLRLLSCYDAANDCLKEIEKNYKIFKKKMEFLVGLIPSESPLRDVFERINSVPVTVEEYLGELSESLNSLSAYREKEFADKYNAPKDAISDKDYEKFISETIGENGSLEKFWKNLKDICNKTDGETV